MKVNEQVPSKENKVGYDIKIRLTGKDEKRNRHLYNNPLVSWKIFFAFMIKFNLKTL